EVIDFRASSLNAAKFLGSDGLIMSRTPLVLAQRGCWAMRSKNSLWAWRFRQTGWGGRRIAARRRSQTISDRASATAERRGRTRSKNQKTLKQATSMTAPRSNVIRDVPAAAARWPGATGAATRKA